MKIDIIKMCQYAYEVKTNLHLFLTSLMDGTEGSASTPAYCNLTGLATG